MTFRNNREDTFLDFESSQVCMSPADSGQQPGTKNIPSVALALHPPPLPDERDGATSRHDRHLHRPNALTINRNRNPRNHGSDPFVTDPVSIGTFFFYRGELLSRFGINLPPHVSFVTNFIRK